MTDGHLVQHEQLTIAVQSILQAVGMADTDAQCVANVLVSADARGVSSHGVAHLSRHIADIQAGLTRLDAHMQVVSQSLAVANYDAQHGLGAVSSSYAMQQAIEKARQCGVGAVAVKNSSHHGLTGYYAKMAIEHGMIGMVTSNTAALAVPTFGIQARLGTNPIAFAAPSATQPPFILDMSTSVVTRGAIEMCRLHQQPIPTGWAVDINGHDPISASQFLDDLLSFQGGLLPLGGKGTVNGGHKGYGLATMVDIISSVLSGGAFSIHVKDTKETAASVNHFFLAIDIKAFRPLADFTKDMDEFLTLLRTTVPQLPTQKVVYAGLLAHEKEQQAIQHGVWLADAIYQQIQKLLGQYHINLVL
jgi:L-2-hydroxycarboxylate dehydrogenase (NAD+)